MATDKIICDTDVMIDYLDNKKARHANTKDIIDNVIGLNNVLISVVTQIELIIGAGNKSELEKINKNIKRFDIVSINEVITAKTVELINGYTLSHGLALPDAFIAASSIISGMVLFNYNMKDYKFIDGVVLYRKG